jgi:hypothetical protein
MGQAGKRRFCRGHKHTAWSRSTAMYHCTLGIVTSSTAPTPHWSRAPNNLGQ